MSFFWEKLRAYFYSINTIEMRQFLKKRTKKLLAVLLLSFVVLFLFRLAYGYKKVNTPQFEFVQTDVSETLLGLRKNYASKKYNAMAGQPQANMDQKYEKIADIGAISAHFEREELNIRKQITYHNGLVQFEDKTGNDGRRKLNLVIGVPPEKFDSLYQKLIKIGNVQRRQITKKDKTNEYKELNAKKASLEKIRESLIQLKSKGGKIEEYMQLENRILDIEQQLQGLGVSLGNFDDENEFCTVKFSLTEAKEVPIGLLQRVKVALEWTITTYLKLMAALTFMTLFAYLLVATIEKLRPKL